MATSYAFVTLISSDAYLPGALTLAAALNDVHPSPPVPPEVPFQTVCLVTPETVDVSTIKLLRKAFDVVIGVEVIGQEDPRGLKLLGRLDLNTVLTKLHIFRLTQFSKIIFLDADILPIRPLSHLFTLPHEFSAAPDVGWPDIFNSGVLVLSPGEEKFTQLTDLLASKGSWDGGDQGLLNEWRGGDWHRLSFTYNTTPTAAYTYAPAYERFGAQISALHFIGPNKPWNSLSYRAPFSSQSNPTSASDPPHQQTYDYNSLVDKWYGVYDKHYRSEPVAPQPQFEVKRYESAWNDRTRVQPLSTPLPGSTLSLQDLRRLAIEGMNASRTVPDDKKSSEGEYHSLPLDGRVDLMRPKKVETPLEHKEEKKEKKRPEVLENLSDSDELPHTPMNRYKSLENDSPPRWHTLPTPGPLEIPPSPRPHVISLPPTPTPHHFSYQPQQHSPDKPPSQQGSSTGHNLHLLQLPEQRQQHHQQHHHHLHHDPRLSPLPELQLESPPEQEPEPQPPVQPQNQNQSPHNQSEQPPLAPPPSQEQEHQEQQQVKQETPRPHSPPMLIWNAAVDPPPTATPKPSAFPSDTYFPNIWDQRPSKESNQLHQNTSPIPDPGSLFQAPPAPEIPESLLKQGHYRNVTGEDHLGSTPSPDRTKVKHVFPWEEKPRHLPGRVFPASDSPTPSLFLSPGSQASSSEVPTTPEAKPARAPIVLSPLHGLPSSLTYMNAWDTVPSIQKYASRLVRPPPARPLAPAFDDDGWQKGRGKSWNERTEASSQDGDVEDEGEDSLDEGMPEGSLRDDESEKESMESLKRHSRRGSSASATRTLIERKKEYKSEGVQTEPKETRDQAVQVAIGLPNQESWGKKNKPTLSSNRRWSPSNPFRPLAPTMSHEASIGPDLSMTTAAPSPTSSTEPLYRPSPMNPLPPSGSPSSRPSRAFSTSSAPSFPVSKVSTTTPPKSTVRIGNSPSLMTRQASNDSSIGSPASSVGPLSPRDSQPIPSPMRKGGRVWDPARGVELFKRGSEEVLARFLKMGSWEDDSNR